MVWVEGEAFHGNTHYCGQKERPRVNKPKNADDDAAALAGESMTINDERERVTMTGHKAPSPESESKRTTIAKRNGSLRRKSDSPDDDFHSRMACEPRAPCDHAANQPKSAEV